MYNSVTCSKFPSHDQNNQQEKLAQIQLENANDQILKDKDLQFKYDEMANDAQLELVKLGASN